MEQVDDAAVIAQALQGQLALMRGVEEAYRRAGHAIPRRAEAFRTQGQAITRAAAHTARCAAYGQRADFVEELAAFPRSGLALITARDLSALRVREHIGASAAPTTLRHVTLPAPPARPRPELPGSESAETDPAAATPSPVPAVTTSAQHRKGTVNTQRRRSLWEAFLGRRSSTN